MTSLPSFIEDYLKEDLCLIPIQPREKKPLVEWKEFQTRKPTEKELAQWFNGKDCNVAVVCGSISNNLCVLDFDSTDNYHKFFDMEKVENRTRVVKTARGIHVWLRTDKPVRSFNVEGLVEVKAEGKYVLVPPSIHPSGVRYEFANSVQTPELITGLEKSVWGIAEKLGYSKKRFSEIQAPRALDGSSVAPNCVATLSQGVSAGNRNDSAIHLASYWLNIRRLSKDYTLEWLNDWNLKNDPPLDQGELLQVVESAARGGYTYKCCLGEKVLRPPKLDELGLADEDVLGTKAHEAADLLMETFHILTLDEDILIYKEGVYRSGVEGILGKVLEDKFHNLGLDKISTNHFHNEVLGHVKRRTSTGREEFDKDQFILNLLNGLLDLRTFEVKPHTPDYPSLIQLTVKYDKNADCPKTKLFLSQVAYADDLPPLQEFSGTILWRQPIQKATLLVGDGGNGKSTFINILKALLGYENISATSLQELEINRFAKADLFGKLANLYADLPDSALKSVGTFKMISGGDPVTAERKFQQRFTFTPFAKHLFSCNRIPEVYEDTTAFFRRWLLIVFPNSFLGQRDNRNLLQELTSPEELSGVLNWMIEGLKRLQAQNWEFSYSKTVEEVSQEWIRKSSPIKAFVMDCCIVTPDANVPKQELFRAFVEYCNKNKLPVLTSDTFFKRLPEHGNITSAKLDIAGKRTHAYTGIGLRDRAEWGKDDAQEELSTN